jgi:hypothetical protein
MTLHDFCRVYSHIITKEKPNLLKDRDGKPRVLIKIAGLPWE